ncbi:MAG: tetratricopeptide repeat protein [Candidatus Heimdallarchaeota archaeon]
MLQEKELIAKAIKLKQQEKFEEAINILKPLYIKNHLSLEVRIALIDVLFNYGLYLNDVWVSNYKKAVECFKNVIELAPDNHRAWYNLGIAYVNHGNIEEALNAYRRAIQIRPDYFYSYYNIGLIYEFHKEDLEKALEYYEKALCYNQEFVYAIQAYDAVQKKIKALRLKKSIEE